MVWGWLLPSDVLEEQVPGLLLGWGRGRRMPPGSSNFGPVLLVFGWFLWPLRRTQLQVTLELITA